jgi:NTP pyrophosphatase (non-canonical NTP hydrolase)
MKEKLADLDRKMGPLFLFSVLIEEVGELSKAIRDNDEVEVKNELVDIIFVAFCFANVYDVKLEPLLISKYTKRSLKEISRKWNDVTWKV